MKDQLSQALDEQLRLRSFLSAVCDPKVNLDDDLLSNLVGSVAMNEVSKSLTLSHRLVAIANRQKLWSRQSVSD
jgi:hypothetical protein